MQDSEAIRTLCSVKEKTLSSFNELIQSNNEGRLFVEHLQH